MTVENKYSARETMAQIASMIAVLISGGIPMEEASACIDGVIVSRLPDAFRKIPDGEEIDHDIIVRSVRITSRQYGGFLAIDERLPYILRKEVVVNLVHRNSTVLWSENKQDGIAFPRVTAFIKIEVARVRNSPVAITRTRNLQTTSNCLREYIKFQRRVSRRLDVTYTSHKTH